MSSLLSWDDFEESATNPSIVQKAKESLANMDISAGVEELREQEQAILARKEMKAQKLNNVADAPDLAVMQSAQNATPVQLGMLNEALRKRIEASLAEVPNIVGTGGRLKVSEKFLLNCTTDLNQLIPFKYGWAWSAYLTSCDKHWMPTEINWLNDEKTYLTLPVSAKKVIMRSVQNYIYTKHTYPNDLLMNMYRLITNPECRQYILRLSFEECCLNHTMRHWEEIFNLGGEVIPGGGLLKTANMIDEPIFQERHLFYKDFTKPLIDQNTVTTGVDNTRTFLKNLIVFFGGVKYISQIGHWLQIVKLAKKYNLEGFIRNAEFVLRDLNRQLEFSVNFISTAIQENPAVFTQEFVDEIQKAFKKAVGFELDFISTLTVDENDYKEASGALKHLSNRYLTDLGFPTLTVAVPKEAQWFVEWLDSPALRTKANHDVTITSTAGTGGLDFGD